MKIFGLMMLVGLAAGGQTSVMPTAVPAWTPIAVPAGQQVVLKAEGRGAQIYLCKNTDAGAKWTFVAPDANLYVDGLGVGTHGAGPVWNYKDGSAVKGTVVTTVDAPNKKGVAWLLLSGVSTGAGLLRGVTYITRTETDGGKVEGEVCNDSAVGTVLRKNYTATYTFYAAK